MLLEDIRKSPNKTNWASSVRDLLSRYGFLNVWLAQGVENSNSFLQHFKQRVRDSFIQEWHARLENSTRARFYVNIANFQYQTYLDILTIAKGEGLRTTRIGLVNRGKIKVNEQKRHSAFLCAEHFYFQDRHLFSCVDPLL